MEHRPLEELCALVDGEKIDLNDYDRRIRLVKRSLSRCNSNQTLPDNRRDHGHATSWKKLANNLYKPIPSYSIYKTYPRDRLKQARAASADPRFRQIKSTIKNSATDMERKSSSNLLGHSDVNVIKPDVSIKPSTSKLNNLHQMKHDNNEVDLSRRVLSKNRIPVRKSRTFFDEMDRQRFTNKEPPAAYQSSFYNKDVTDLSYYGSAHSIQKNNVAPEMTDEGTSEAVETVEFESLQENFISSLQQDKKESMPLLRDKHFTPRSHIDWQDTIVNTDDEIRTNNPDWSTIEVYKSQNVSPHLIRHCPVIKSKNLLKKSTSSWTMPVVKHKLPPGVCVCQKCDCNNTSNNGAQKGHRGKSGRRSYVYDGYNTDVTSRKSKMMQDSMGVWQKLWVQFLANYHILMCFIFGSLVGLVLVASVVWLLSSDQLWTLFNKKEIRRINPVRAAISSVINGVNFVANSIVGIIYQTIMLPRNAVYSTKDETTLSELFMSLISS